MDEELKNEPTENVSHEVSEYKEYKIEEEVSEAPKKEKKPRKTDFYIELALFLILGVLIGVAAKDEARKTVTIGYDDYKMKIYSQDYDINQLQAAQDQKRAAASQQPSDNSQPSDGSSPDAGNPSADNSAPASDNSTVGNDNSANNNSPAGANSTNANQGTQGTPDQNSGQ